MKILELANWSLEDKGLPILLSPYISALSLFAYVYVLAPILVVFANAHHNSSVLQQKRVQNASACSSVSILERMNLHKLHRYTSLPAGTV